MLDPFDYKEPTCPLGGGEEFYYPDNTKNVGKIPVNNIILKLDSYLNKEDYDSSVKLLKYWHNEAILMNDTSSELSILNEILGLSRKVNDKEWGLKAIEKCLLIFKEKIKDETFNIGTIYLNLATTLKCFARSEKSIEYYKKAEEIYNKTLDKNDKLFSGLYNNFALALVDTKEYQKATEYYVKALLILKDRIDGLLDSGITYINMADMYYDSLDDEKVGGEYMQKAYHILKDKRIEKNGYCAFVYRKCAESFGYRGYFLIKNNLNKIADEIYERNRIR